MLILAGEAGSTVAAVLLATGINSATYDVLKPTDSYTSKLAMTATWTAVPILLFHDSTRKDHLTSEWPLMPLQNALHGSIGTSAFKTNNIFSAYEDMVGFKSVPLWSRTGQTAVVVLSHTGAG